MKDFGDKKELIGEHKISLICTLLLSFHAMMVFIVIIYIKNR